MKTTPLMLIGAMLALSSCDLFVPPPVACDKITLVWELSGQETRKGMGCAWPDPLTGQVAHSVAVDPTWAKDNNGGNELLVGAPVRVTGVGAALCEGMACEATEPEINIKVDEMGRLTYGVALPPPFVGGGKEINSTGLIVSEVYGPGNECYIEAAVKASCAEAPETTNP
ncbi:MAG TPA: hypothetical protein VGK67_34330 [Myxococcales bacterium]|jgi:hypothetical protein